MAGDEAALIVVQEPAETGAAEVRRGGALTAAVGDGDRRVDRPHLVLRLGAEQLPPVHRAAV